MAKDAHLLTDIALTLQNHIPNESYLASIFSVAEREVRAPQRPLRLLDFQVTSGRRNLVQAVLMRVLTPRGELSPLGHPEYGSRLHELIGRVNTETTRNLMKLFILEALALEPRIQQKIDVTVTPADSDPPKVGKGARNVTLGFTVLVEIVVRPVGETETVTIGPFTLELGP